MNKFFIIIALLISLFSAENKKPKQEDKKQAFKLNKVFAILMGEICFVLIVEKK